MDESATNNMLCQFAAEGLVTVVVFIAGVNIWFLIWLKKSAPNYKLALLFLPQHLLPAQFRFIAKGPGLVAVAVVVLVAIVIDQYVGRSIYSLFFERVCK